MDFIEDVWLLGIKHFFGQLIMQEILTLVIGPLATATHNCGSAPIDGTLVTSKVNSHDERGEFGIWCRNAKWSSPSLVRSPSGPTRHGTTGSAKYIRSKLATILWPACGGKYLDMFKIKCQEHNLPWQIEDPKHKKQSTRALIIQLLQHKSRQSGTAINLKWVKYLGA